MRGDWLDEFAATGKLPDPATIATWTPALVGETLIEAVRWVHYTGGTAGPDGFRGVGGVFKLQSTLADHLDEGWGLPEIAGDDDPEERLLYVPPKPRTVSLYEAALEWPSEYLDGDHNGAGAILAVWVRCKVFRRSFDGAVTRRGTISRGAAYRLRDRGLSMISQGLDRDRVPMAD